MKRYFTNRLETLSEDRCYPLETIKEAMKRENVKELIVNEAKVEKGTGFFFCLINDSVGRVGEGCGKECPDYLPRNGKNGRCINSGHVYDIRDKYKKIKL